jgi:hypothetical protein
MAAIGSVLLIAGRDQALEPFRATAMTLLVASLDDCLERFTALGIDVIAPPKTVPTGRNMLVRHPDGALVEYVEHRLNPSNPEYRCPESSRVLQSLRRPRCRYRASGLSS